MAAHQLRSDQSFILFASKNFGGKNERKGEIISLLFVALFMNDFFQANDAAAAVAANQDEDKDGKNIKNRRMK